jgi:hypothetical protein
MLKNVAKRKIQNGSWIQGGDENVLFNSKFPKSQFFKKKLWSNFWLKIQLL